MSFENSNTIEKIETIFSKELSKSFAGKKELKNAGTKKLKLKHLFWLPSLMYRKTYELTPKILKDIFFSLSIIHKSPNSKFFAKTRYEELRILLDIKISSLVLKIIPSEYASEASKSFKSGFCTFNLSNISELNPIIENVISYSNPSHAGAKPYFKDGKREEIKNSFSTYYTFSKQDNKNINSFIDKNLNKDFNYHLSALAGYKCEIKDLIYSLSIVRGENSNSEMHQDTYGSVAKGFIYLQDTKEGNSPFEYLKGSYIDAAYRSQQTNTAVMSDDLYSSGSTRIRHKVLDNAINKYGIKTFTGSKGLFILANTSGYHRKGSHKSEKPRIMLACGVERKGMINKLARNLYEIFKYKVFKALNK